MSWVARACALAIAGLTSGCVEHMSVLERRATGAPIRKPEFWPPPGGTSLWISEEEGGFTFGDAARRVAGTLRRAGYEDERWYPIGVEYVHGFAVTTRLERVAADGRPAEGRWSSLYPGALELVWFKEAGAMTLPAPGRYRAFLVAFTDLPLGHVAQRPPRLDEDTFMVAPDIVPAMHFPAAHRAPLSSRVYVFVYVYASQAPDGLGALVASDPVPAGVQIENSGLLPLGSLSRAER
jgi:hypothetical protein